MQVKKGPASMAYHEFSIRVPGLFKDALIRKLVDSGCLGVVENNDTLIAYFPEATDKDTIQSELSILKAVLKKADGQAGELDFTYALIPDQDWNETWKKGFLPIDVGERFAVIPPWEEEKPGRINLIIDPAMAFGTGHHETTRSCLSLMEKYLEKTAHVSFLDLGTGTGILAIAAKKLGYRHVVGIDMDPLSIDAAIENIAINHVTDVVIREGSLSEDLETYDVIAANLISGVLVQLAQALFSHMTPGGIAILSGVLLGQEDEVIEAMKRTGLRLVEKFRDGKWLSLVVQRGKKR